MRNLLNFFQIILETVGDQRHPKLSEPIFFLSSISLDPVSFPAFLMAGKMTRLPRVETETQTEKIVELVFGAMF